MFRVLAIAAALAGLATAAGASIPVPKTYQGCVRNGAYVVEPYVIRLFDLHRRQFDLRRYEGMRLWVRGDLAPGDIFFVREGPRVLGPCR